MKLITPIIRAIVASALILPMVSAAPRALGRANYNDKPVALPLSGYKLPLQGSKTCTAPGQCVSELPQPPSDKSLKILAVARGINTYSCAGRSVVESPLFQNQDATLWDASPLLEQIPDEEYFHALIKQLHDFDYTAMKNSSLTCIGAVSSDKSQSVFKIVDIVNFATYNQAIVDAPYDPSINAPWSYSISTNFLWSVYRVETVGGSPPQSCQGQGATIKLDYAAEYWFYS